MQIPRTENKKAALWGGSFVVDVGVSLQQLPV